MARLCVCIAAAALLHTTTEPGSEPRSKRWRWKVLPRQSCIRAQNVTTVERLRLGHLLVLALGLVCVHELLRSAAFHLKHLIQHLRVGFGRQAGHSIGAGAARIFSGRRYGGNGEQGDASLVLVHLKDNVLKSDFGRSGGMKIIRFVSFPGLGHWLGVKNMFIIKSA